jgi:hypothetical protein
VPGRPTGITASPPTANAVTLSWRAPATSVPASFYTVYRGATWIAATSTTTVTLNELWRDTTYPFTVVANGPDGGESVHGVAPTVTTVSCDPAPPAPTAVTAAAVSASSVALGWVSEVEATSYTVVDGSLPAGTVEVASAMVTGLASASAHRFAVYATLPGGCGRTPLSVGVNATTAAGPTRRPAAPTGLAPLPLPPSLDPFGTIAITWTQPPGVDPVVSWRVYEGATVIGTSTRTSFSTRLPPATRHLVSVVAVDAAGNESSQSAPTTVTASFVLPP